MSVNIIDNQPIRFRLSTEIAEESCDCSRKPYCQMVNKNDQTKWQITTNDLVTNGSFASNLSGWAIGIAVELIAVITNESTDGACDGEVVLTASGGTGPYTYSKDGVSYQSSNTFTGLCAECYGFIVKDADDNKGYATICIVANIQCGLYDSTDELIPFETSQLLNCLTSDFI